MMSIDEVEKELKRVGAELRISKGILAEALELYTETRPEKETDLLKNRTPKSLIAGSLRVVLKLHRELITLSEIANAFNEDRKEVAKVSRILYRGKGPEPVKFVTADTLEVRVYIIGKRLDIYGHTLDYAETLMKKAYKEGVNSWDWMDVAGAAIFIAAVKRGEKITLEDVAKASKVDKKVLLDRVNEIRTALNGEL